MSRRFIIYGLNAASIKVKDICLLIEGSNSVVGFMDFDEQYLGSIDGIKVFALDQVLDMYRKGEIDGILLPREQDYLKRNYWGRLIYNGVKIDDLFLCKWLRECDDKDFIQRLVMSNYLPYVDIHLTDHCNLNCAYCEHYSPIVNESVFHSVAEIERGLTLLKKYIDDIGMIRLLGGEPLLHKDIGTIIGIVRKLYPYTRLKVVTNGLLLFDMPEDFFQILRDTDTGVDLSLYPEIHKTKDEVMEFFKNKGIERRSFCSPVIDFFSKKQILKPHNKKEWTFRHCYQSTCNNLYGDKIAACFLPFVTKYFNREFKTDIPQGEYLDLNSEDLTTEKLKRFLLTPMDRCRYCEIPCDAVRWRRMKYPSKMEDFVKDEE